LASAPARARRPAADAHATARLYIDLADRIVQSVLVLDRDQALIHLIHSPKCVSSFSIALQFFPGSQVVSLKPPLFCTVRLSDSSGRTPSTYLFESLLPILFRFVEVAQWSVPLFPILSELLSSNLLGAK
jgi:hypothetical protein